MRLRWKRYLLAIAIAALAPAFRANAESPSPAGTSDASAVPGLIAIPAEAGYVIGTSAAADPSAPTIIQIQEAHTNYEGQRHLVDILQYLVDRHGLKLILVEGSDGDASIARMRSYATLERRREVGDRFMKLGILSGEEYLDLVSDVPLVIWGIEDGALYDQQYETFVAAEAQRPAAEAILQALQDDLKVLEPHAADPAMSALIEHQRAFKEQRVELANYVDSLVDAAGAGPSPDQYPALAGFLQARLLERGLNQAEVAQEQQQLMQRLNALASRPDVESLVAQAEQVKLGVVARDSFYRGLLSLAERSRVNTSEFPALSRYVRYLEERARVEPLALSAQLDQFAAEVRRGMPLSRESAAYYGLVEAMDLVAKLVALKLTPEEYGAFERLGPAVVSDWETPLRELCGASGAQCRALDRLPALTAALPVFQEFYETAHRRDEALTARIRTKLDETGQPLAVVIVGGFHSPRITDMLKDQGFSVVSVVPKISQPTDERLYHAVLRYKAGKGRFEDVVRIAEGAQAEDPPRHGSELVEQGISSGESR